MWQVHHEQLLYPYHVQWVQALVLLILTHAKNFVSCFFDSGVKIPSLAAVYCSLMKQALQGTA
jgi:hypothetical protein